MLGLGSAVGSGWILGDLGSEAQMLGSAVRRDWILLGDLRSETQISFVYLLILMYHQRFNSYPRFP